MLLPSKAKVTNPQILHSRIKRGYGPITTPAGTTCGLCHRQVSQYTCPKCNIPYCSLICFRSENHAQCSELFYKREIETEIQTQPAASAEERARMIDMLKRLEDGENEDDKGQDFNEGDEEAEDELLKKLESVDLDTISPDQLWALLPPSKRAAFLKSVQNPDSASARVLISEVEKEAGGLKVPWWVEEPEDVVDVGAFGDEGDDGSSEINPAKEVAKERPVMMDLPPAMLMMPSTTAIPQSAQVQSPSLLYNVLAVILTYAYTTRHFGVSTLSSLIPLAPETTTPTESSPSQSKTHSNPEEDIDPFVLSLADARAASQTMHNLSPFLGDRNSKIVFGSVDAVNKDLWGRLEAEENKGAVGKASNVAQTMILLLQDALTIFVPKRVAVVDSNDSSATSTQAPLIDHTHSPVLLALSDAVALLEALANPQLKPSPILSNPVSPKPIDARSARAVHKLRFYAAWIVRTISAGDVAVQYLMHEIQERMMVLEREAETMETGGSAPGDVKVRE